MSCKAAGDDRNHQKRPEWKDGYCHTCHYARKRRRRAQGRASSAKVLYGLSVADLAALRAAQRGRCPCGRRVGVVKEPSIDHWHGCPHCGGKGCRRCVRGLLCGPCNVHLGYVGDRPEALIALALHAVTMPAQAVFAEMDRRNGVDNSD